MTVINPNSISGITSITLPSGDGNVLTIHTNDGTERFRIDSSGNVKVGSACTISQDGDVFFTGVCTATTLTGAASGLTGALPAISGANLTNLTAGNLTGTLPAISGANLTGIAATDNVRTGILDVAGVSTFRNTMNVGAAVTISESGIEASGIGITCANINGTQIGGTRNLIMNGSQIIDQRNGGSAVTPSNASQTFITDRFLIFEDTDGVVSAQQSTTAPDGFTKSLKIDCTTADTSLSASQRLICETRIEGNNIAHLGFGSSAAKTITLSFYVRSNLTGTFGGVIKNSGESRVYIFSYSISSANTWERKTITIPGDTTGTWLTTNGTGITINWGLALGSNWTGTAGSYGTSDKHGVTGQLNLLSSTDNEWLLTGFQLEVGSQATAFEHRSFGDELALCQRYFEITEGGFQGAVGSTDSDVKVSIPFRVTKRASPTLATISTDENCCSSVSVETNSQDATLGARVVGNNVFADGSNKFFVAKFSADSEL